MSEAFSSAVTFSNREGGVLHLPGTGSLPRISHDISAITTTSLLETSWGVWAAASSQREDFCLQYPQQGGLLQQTMRDLVAEIAQAVENSLSGGEQTLDGASYCIASVIVQRFAEGNDAATIAQTLLGTFPGMLHNQSATNLVVQATKMIQAVRPGWKRQVLTPDEENPSPPDSQAPSSGQAPSPADLPAEAETPVEHETESFDTEASTAPSADSAIPRIPVGELPTP